MLIVALVLAAIGLAALVTAVVTHSQVIAWVCIGASVIGVVLLIIDAIRERRQHDAPPEYDADYPEEPPAEDTATEETEAESSDSETSR